MPVALEFATLLRLLTLPQGEKTKFIQKIVGQRKGSFWAPVRDGWRPLRDALSSHVGHGFDRQVTEEIIEANSGQNILEPNLVAFRGCADWIAKQTGTMFIPSRTVWFSPNRVFSVRIDPEIGLASRRGAETVVAVYPRSDRRFKREQAGAALVLLEQAYRQNAPTTFGILDTGGGTLYKAKSASSGDLLDAEVAVIEDLLKPQSE